MAQQSRQDRGAFNSVISASVTTDSETRRAAGTIFGNNMPRLVQIDDHKLEAYLDGVLLVFTHTDVPGIIGRVGTIFGQHKVNIAQMSVGRTAPGGAATGVLNLDGEPQTAALNDVRVQELGAAVLAQYDDGSLFENINTPHDYARARDRVALNEKPFEDRITE